MVNHQALSIGECLDNQQQAQLSLATMQADIDKALRIKRQDNAETSDVVKLDTVNAHTVDSNEVLSKPVDSSPHKVLDASQISRVIEMAWEDRTPFAAIEHSYGLNEANVIKLMRQELKPSSFRLWRQRVTGRATKHQAKRSFLIGRAYCKTQYKPR